MEAKMRLGWVVIGLVILSLALGGCGRRTGESGGTGRSQVMEIKGSDTMVNLGQAWAERFSKEHPGSSISVTGGGSGIGIASLINGTSDLTQASREMKESEFDSAKAKGMDPKEFVVAQDGLSVIVHRSNPVTRLTVDQLSDIYTGKVTNWKLVGGKDEKIVAISREKSSGTHVFFLEHVVRKGNAKGTEEFAPATILSPSSQSISDEVTGNPAAIGYVGMGYVDHAKHSAVQVANGTNSPNVDPTPENVINGSYPIARPLYMYTPNEPTGVVKEFIDFTLSDEGQKIVLAQEFVPVRDVR